MKVVILSPSKYSLYTLAALTGLQRADVDVVGVGLCRLVNFSRILSEGRRDGARLIKKIWTKLIRRNAIFNSEEKESLSSYLKENKIPLEKVTDFCRRGTIKFRYCNNFNDQEFIEWVKSLNADAIISTGGGLIRQPLLQATPKGILNCHMGILPMYRGMDLPEWAILNSDLKNIGCCVHIMDKGVDTGAILKNYPVKVMIGDNIRRLRNRIEYCMCSAMVETSVDYLRNKIQPMPQSMEDGKQFFKMARTLVDLAENRLQLFLDDHF